MSAAVALGSLPSLSLRHGTGSDAPRHVIHILRLRQRQPLGAALAGLQQPLVYRTVALARQLLPPHARQLPAQDMALAREQSGAAFNQAWEATDHAAHHHLGLLALRASQVLAAAAAALAARLAWRASARGRRCQLARARRRRLPQARRRRAAVLLRTRGPQCLRRRWSPRRIGAPTVTASASALPYQHRCPPLMMIPTIRCSRHRRGRAAARLIAAEACRLLLHPWQASTRARAGEQRSDADTAASASAAAAEGNQPRA